MTSRFAAVNLMDSASTKSTAPPDAAATLDRYSNLVSEPEIEITETDTPFFLAYVPTVPL